MYIIYIYNQTNIQSEAYLVLAIWEIVTKVFRAPQVEANLTYLLDGPDRSSILVVVGVSNNVIRRWLPGGVLWRRWPLSKFVLY